MLKVFASGAGQNDVAARYPVVEAYPAFVIVDVSDADATALAADHLVEDITDQYAIPLGGDAHVDDRRIECRASRHGARQRRIPTTRVRSAWLPDRTTTSSSSSGR